MPGGRPPKPLKVLEMSGALKKNPKRARARAAKATKVVLPPIGPPPEEWTSQAEKVGRCRKLVACWHELIEQDRVLKVLNSSHRALLRMACVLQYQIDEAVRLKGRAPSGDFAQLKSTLSAMGMTPVDSSHVMGAVRERDPDAGSRHSADGPNWGQYGTRGA
ncbi:hypothetical protein ACOBR2_06630 [Telmatobacter bradus]|uniref:hypothetical protein n=1 Tax=Telmatobacter bradus TaxID=474953 RepID=UPI003B42AA7F